MTIAHKHTGLRHRRVDTGCTVDQWATIYTVDHVNQLPALHRWMAPRAGQMLGLDSETNAQNPYGPALAVRAVQIADRHTAWVLDVAKLGASVVASIVHFHQYWVAQFPGGAELPFLANGLPGSVRLDEDQPHISDLQVVLAWYDPRTVVTSAKKDGLDPRITRPRGLKDTCTRELSPVLEDVETAMHQWFRDNAPKGHRVGERLKVWGFANVPFDLELYQVYSGLDALMTIRLWEKFWAALLARGVPVASIMEDLYDQWDCDRAVYRGLPVDAKYARWLDGQLGAVVSGAAEYLAAYGIKPSASGPQVGAAFASLGITSPKVTKNNAASWDKEVLKELAKRDDAAGLLAQTVINVRQATKFHSAYVQPMLAALELDGRVHCDLRALGTVTGRMSAARPAIQQLPKKDTRVRAAYGDLPGWVFVSCDLAQGEPRTMAALSGDPAYVAAVNTGDINNAVTAQTFPEFNPAEGKIPGTPSYAWRQGVKQGFLACCYGGGPRAVDHHMDVGLDECQQHINVWKSSYPVMFGRWDRMNQGVEITLANGWRVPLWDRFTVNDTGALVVYPKPSRKAGNYETQGTQKLYLKRAWREMVRRGWAWALAMFVHDEILLLVPEFMAAQAMQDLRECMTFDLGNGVTMECEAEINGRTWMPQPSDFDLRELKAVEL